MALDRVVATGLTKGIAAVRLLCDSLCDGVLLRSKVFMIASPNGKTAVTTFSAKSLGRRAEIVAVCVACFLAVAAAPSARGDSPSSATDPRPLANQLTAELQLVYRDNVPEYTRRSEQLQKALAAWNASGKTAVDQTRITAWLHDAIRASMPGPEKSMPRVPSFAVADAKPVQTSAAQNGPVVQPTASKSLAVKSPVASVPAKQHDSSLLVKKASPTERGAAGEIEKTQPAGASSKQTTEGDPFRDDASPN
jgi:hypothetical protein